MKDYSKYKECEFCGKYDMPPSKYWSDRGLIEDRSMVCNGVRTLGPDPFLADIHEDDSDYLMCDGERHDSAMNR